MFIKKFESINQRLEKVDPKLDKVMNTLVYIVGELEAMREDQVLALGKNKEF